ncbi:MAG: iron ABC transporter permease [Planctomycetota bacterium]
MRRSDRAFLIALAALLVAAVLLHLGVARESPGIADSLRSLASAVGIGTGDPVDEFVVTRIRLPRLVVALFGGASLGVAGAVMQATFRNPLASPDIVGTAAGAAFGGAAAIVLGYAAKAILIVPLFSLCGALGVTWLVFALAASASRFSTTALLLAGVALNTLVGALTTFIVTFTFDNYTASSRVLFWLMGGLDSRTWEHASITAGGFFAFAALVVPRIRILDLLTLGNDSIHALGLDAHGSRRGVLWLACGLTATTVANTGGIAFVGLVVPHLARMLVGPSHRTLLPASALLGALLLVLADLGCRNVPPDWNLRLGVVTSMLGAPYFLWLLARHKRGEALA